MNPTRRQVLWGVLAVTLVLVAVVLSSAAIVSAVKSSQVRNTQTENTPLLKNTNETLEIIKGCTTPGQACYDRGQKQTAEYIQGLTNDLTRVSAYAAGCADKPQQQSTDEIFACVVTRLAQTSPAR